MLTIRGGGTGKFCDGISRRDFLKIGGLALGGLSLTDVLAAEAKAGIRSSHKAIIMVFLPGGPAGAPFYDDAFFEVMIPTSARHTSWGRIKNYYH